MVGVCKICERPEAAGAIGRPKGGMSQRGCEMRRCVLCGRWVLLAFQVEVGGFVSEAARLGLGGGVGE